LVSARELLVYGENHTPSWSQKCFLLAVCIEGERRAFFSAPRAESLGESMM
jgi:hypothetical protein